MVRASQSQFSPMGGTVGLHLDSSLAYLEGIGAFPVGREEGVLQSHRTVPYRKKGVLLKVKGVTLTFFRAGNTWRK